MTSSRLSGRELSTTEWLDVQANWLGVDITDVNLGSFMGSVQWVGNIGLISWLFKFNNVASSGTSGAFKLTAPGLARVPEQWLDLRHRGLAYVPLLNSGIITVTMPLTSGYQVALRGTISTENLNY